MEMNGWEIEVEHDVFSMDKDALRKEKLDIHPILAIQKRCRNNTWYGFRGMMGDAKVTKVFKTKGHASLSFGNCGDPNMNGTVTAILLSNGTQREIGKVTQGKQETTSTFNFQNNDLLKIEETGQGIIKLFSFTVVCEPEYIIINRSNQIARAIGFNESLIASDNLEGI